MKFAPKKLNKKGFSAVEIVVALVVVVVVAGLGFFAYNSRSSNSGDTSSNNTTEFPDEASASAPGWTSFGRSSSGNQLARGCLMSYASGKSTIKVQIFKKQKGNKTIESTSVKGFQKSGKKINTTTLGNQWWLGFMQEKTLTFNRSVVYKVAPYFGGNQIGSMRNLDDLARCR